MSRDKFNNKKAGKGRKRCTIFVDARRKKIPCYRGKGISWISIGSHLSDAGVSVSSKTFRSRSVDARLKGRIPRKKAVPQFKEALIGATVGNGTH
ncbi:hypothetical protein TNCV_330841 [Trichonephila clavipes]|nr:hypothetical protein TNCV_330841 [Trichonephila clavipes]